METRLFEIEFKDGRVFRIFCANKKQIQRVIRSWNKIKDACKDVKVIANGIHTTKQWEQIISKQ